MRDANSVAVYDSGPSVRDRSNEALNPRSASSGCWIVSRVRPAASVSSVIGVGPKKPVPTDSRLVQRPARASADTRGLKNVPYSLWTSSRPLDESDNAGVTLTSYCANDARHREGVVELRHIARRVGVAFDREAGHPRLAARGSTNRHFAERRIVPIALQRLRQTDDRGSGARPPRVPSPRIAR